MLAGKTEITIRLAIRSSDRIFRRQRALITPSKWGHPDKESEKIAKASEFCDDLPRYYGAHQWWLR